MISCPLCKMFVTWTLDMSTNRFYISEIGWVYRKNTAMKFIILFLTSLRLAAAVNFNVEPTSTEFALRFKSIKCTIADPSKVKMNFCYVKAHSRTLTSINAGFELLENFEFPSNVSHTIKYETVLYQ